MNNPYHAMLAEMAAELDWSQQRLMNNRTATHPLADRARVLIAQPEPELVNTHYEWELQDADGNWQAGGSANSLNDVRREGTRYLQTYAQDGPHKLIISQHATQVIDEMTNV